MIWKPPPQAMRICFGRLPARRQCWTSCISDSGPDGHTASLVPGDPVVDVTDRDVAVTGVYQERRRMTLTYPVLNRARCILWLVNGPEKAQILQRLASGDVSIPAGRIQRDTAVVLADRAAASNISATETKETSCA